MSFSILIFHEFPVFHQLPVPSPSTALRISSGKPLCANRFAASFFGAALRYASIASWMLDFICACFLHVLWEGESSLLFSLMRWAASQGDRRGVSSRSILGGGATLGGVSISDIFGVGGSWGVGTRPGSGNADQTFCGSATCTLLVYFGGVIGAMHSLLWDSL